MADDEIYETFREGWEEGYDAGAAALGGLLGMADAIRARRWKCPTCRCSPSIMTQTCSCCDEPVLEEDEMGF